MGLFDVFKKEEKKEKEVFKSVVVRTDNVSKSLTDVSQKYNIPISNLDFDILAIDTYVKLTKDEDFVSIDMQTLELIKDKNLLLDENFEIRQSYEIKIRKYKFQDDFELIGKIKVDKSKTKAVYYLSPSSILNYSDTLEFQIVEELKKKKLKSGMLVDFEFFEEKFLEDIKTLVAKIRVLGMVEEDYPITLCEAIKPIESIPLKIIEHYKKNQSKHELVKEFIYPIKKDSIIIEIIKPKEGKDGRDCKGNLLKVHRIEETQIPSFKINDDITKKEDDDKILYISNKSGYVYIKDGVIFIKDELEVNQISLKTGNVRGAEDSNVKLEVKEKGALKEAIKDGMVVETTELIVNGNVGNGAKIKAKKLQIDGQTHKKSKILAQNAQINAHKGYLKANKAIIERLEGGIVEAKQVLITQAISGKVIAKEIKVKLLGSHITLIASDLIEIEVLKGTENKFIIDEGVVDNKEEYIKEVEEKYKKLEIKIRQYKEKFEENKQIIKETQPNIQKMKLKIQKDKEQGLGVNPLFMQKIKRFNDFVKKTKQIEAKAKDLMIKLRQLKEELNKLQQGAFLAKIISHSGFKEFNRIEYHLIEPPMNITYDTKPEDEYKNIFVLKDYGDFDYQIVGESE